MAIELRDCTEADLHQILPIWTHFVKNTKLTPEIDPPTFGSLRSQWEMVLSAGYPYYVTVKDGKVVGWALIRRYASVTDSAFRFSAVAESWIAPDAMGLGIGKIHQSALLNRLKELPVKEVMIPYTSDYRDQLTVFGLDFPNTQELGLLENVCEKNGETFSIYIRQFTTGWSPKL